jgi:hypothetical protein
MQLSGEARMRNRALDSASPVSRPATAVRTGAPAASASTYQAMPSMQIKGLRYAMQPPAVEGKILGGRFDAYA